MNCIQDFHWIWYGLGFIFSPRLTVMIMLSIYFPDFLPLPLMIIGWVCAFFGFVSFNFKGGNK